MITTADKQWVQEFGNENDFAWDMASCIATDDSSHVYVAGYTTNNSGNTDYALFNTVWEMILRPEQSTIVLTPSCYIKTIQTHLIVPQQFLSK